MKSRFRSVWAHNVSSIRNYIWSMDRGICNWESSANEAAALVDFFCNVSRHSLPCVGVCYNKQLIA